MSLTISNIVFDCADPVPMIDGLMAATAKVSGLDFVTRNTADLARTAACVR